MQQSTAEHVKRSSLPSVSPLGAVTRTPPRWQAIALLQTVEDLLLRSIGWGPNVNPGVD